MKRTWRLWMGLWILGGGVGSLGGCLAPRWPAEGPLTSPFGLRIRGWRVELHRGVDLALAEGTPVKAMARGRVRYAGTMDGYGTVVWLEHSRHILSVYAHLSRVEVRVGESVVRGQVIGRVGRSGRAESPHLHFEIRRRGREVDPVQFLGGFPRQRRRP